MDVEIPAIWEIIGLLEFENKLGIKERLKLEEVFTNINESFLEGKIYYCVKETEKNKEFLSKMTEKGVLEKNGKLYCLTLKFVDELFRVTR